MNHAARLAAARAAMEAAEVDAMIVSGLVNIRYLTGFAGLERARRARPAHLHAPDRLPLPDGVGAAAAVGRRRAGRARRDPHGGRPPGGLTGGAGRIGFEPAQLTVERHAILAEVHEGLVPVPASSSGLRVTKDAEELDAVRASAALIEPVYAAAGRARA